MRILATDLDRTLLPNGSWPADPSAIDLFNELTERHGVTVVYVTGRNLDLAENVALPGFYAHRLTAAECRSRSARLLERMGLGHRQSHVPAALSGGERQRGAIARALFNRPSILLADEPTGNLDARNTRNVMDIFSDLSRSGITIVLVTHDRAVAGYAGRTVELNNGSVTANVAH